MEAGSRVKVEEEVEPVDTWSMGSAVRKVLKVKVEIVLTNPGFFRFYRTIVKFCPAVKAVFVALRLKIVISCPEMLNEGFVLISVEVLEMETEKFVYKVSY